MLTACAGLAPEVGSADTMAPVQTPPGQKAPTGLSLRARARLPSASLEALRAIGRQLFDGGYYTRCAQIQLYLVLAHPEALEGWYLLGRCLDEEGEGDKALRAYALGGGRGARGVFSALASDLRRREADRDLRLGRRRRPAPGARSTRARGGSPHVD